jgi:hypothetical protein
MNMTGEGDRGRHEEVSPRGGGVVRLAHFGGKLNKDAFKTNFLPISQSSKKNNTAQWHQHF